MPRAIALPIRKEIAARRAAGESLTAIAQQLQMSYRTVRKLWYRFRDGGEAALAPQYHRCGRTGPRFAASVVEAALAMKREHPRWGALVIRLELAGPFPDQRLPSERTLQDWFRRAGLNSPPTRRPPANVARAKRPHEVWQIDAKEQLRHLDGSASVLLAATDEATGAMLGAAIFPPGARQPDASFGGGGLDGAAR